MLELRDARVEDLDSIFEIEQQAFPDPYPKALLKAFLFFPGAYLVVLSEGKMIGYAIGIVRYSDQGHIISIAINREYRRGGAGETLLTELVERLRKIGSTQVYLEVRQSNIAAISLYKKIGFVEKGKKERYYSDGETALEMRLSLK